MSERGVCSVGTSDPWNAAGIGLDIRTLAELRTPVFTVIAGVSAQDARGLHAARAIEPEMIAAQFAALERAPIGAIRIGALLDAASMAAVADALEAFNVPVVYDPVLGPSGGGRFIEDAMLGVLRDRLLPRVTVITPNCREASYLSGISIGSLAALRDSAAALASARRAALVKGFVDGERGVDVFAGDGAITEFAADRIDAPMRGTGCLLAAALAARLCAGDAALDAIAFARAFVARKLRAAKTIGGMRVPP